MDCPSVKAAEKLPCGCILDAQVINGVNTFVMVPCALDCQFYVYALEESKRQGKPPRIVDAR
jgi:hypothetical protein